MVVIFVANGEGVDLTKIKPEVEYTLKQLAEIFDCSISTLRNAIRDKELKRIKRRKRKKIYVWGKDAIAYWVAD
jgi:hypothetical protein